MKVRWLPYDMPAIISVFGCRLSACLLTEFFARGNVSQSSIRDDLTSSIPHPSHVLFLGRVIEHASQSEYDGLCDLAVTVRIYDWPIARMGQIPSTSNRHFDQM